VNHEQFTVAGLRLNGVEVPLRYGHLVVVHNANATDEDWECLASSTDDVALEPAPYDLHVTTTEGTRLRGDAVMVRSDGRSHVFRGVGVLLPL
jgi:hypothetical protein